MTKYGEDSKKKLIELMEGNQYSFASASKVLNISATVAKRWWKMYQTHGYEGLVMKSKTYTGEFKVYAVKYLHDNHLSINEASAQLGIPSDSTLLNWERTYYEKGEEGLLVENRGRHKIGMHEDSNKPSKKRISKDAEEDLIIEVQRLRAENAYLKKYNALVQEKKNLQAKKKQR
ncbi:MAG: helix-turn-helix domain-containing protein [Clostridia bacterium]|nr:helix-turn-helix domain-containing protein [Clostridia bacterium]